MSVTNVYMSVTNKYMMVTNIYTMFFQIKSVVEELTARGSCTGLVTVGPTKV